MFKEMFWKLYAFFYFNIVDYLCAHQLFGFYTLKRIDKKTKKELPLKPDATIHIRGNCPYCKRMIET